MPSTAVLITEYKTLVTAGGPVLEIKCRAAQSGTEYLITLLTPDVLSVLASVVTTLQTADAPVDAAAAALLFRTTMIAALLAKLVELGKLDA